MGNGLGNISRCLSVAEDASAEGSHRWRHHSHDTQLDPSSCYYDEGLGHSFCYVRPDPSRLSSSKVHHHHHEGQHDDGNGATTFRSISGASVSANTSTTPLSSANNPASMLLMADFTSAPAAAFDCTDSFSSVPLQPVPRGGSSGPLSGPIDRGFLSGPIERGFMSGPIDSRSGGGIFSGPLDSRSSASGQSSASAFPRSFSHGAGYGYGSSSFFRPRSRKASALMRGLGRAIARTLTRGHNSIVAPIKFKGTVATAAAGRVSGGKESGCMSGGGCNATGSTGSQGNGDQGVDGDENVQWAQGKAGEDRVHVVVSEEYGWVFVGIYDGFNGPDAPDYLLTNLYPAVHGELKGLLWEDKYGNSDSSPCSNISTPSPSTTEPNHSDRYRSSTRKRRRRATAAENRRRWRCEWERDELPPRHPGGPGGGGNKDRRHHHYEQEQQQQHRDNKTSAGSVTHGAVLKALSRALQRTEDTYLGIADNVVGDNPELALMGSCVLVMLMKGEDVYLMNVGDSRAVLARADDPRKRNPPAELDMIGEDAAYDDGAGTWLEAVQLTRDHSTSVEEEVQRILREHPDDAAAVSNDRVKGSLKVTRAFGAGFLKQPRWNEALLEMFRIEYVGTSPYISCTPSLRHHRLSPRDRFLILSSDGLYQYLSNEEAVAEVESFIASSPDGDPAQHLVEEVLFRAAKRAGMDFHELLEIPQGDRRRYHDDVSIIVISLEGRIWRSSM